MYVKNVNANLLSKILKQIAKTRSKAETFPKCHPFWLPLVQTMLNGELNAPGCAEIENLLNSCLYRDFFNFIFWLLSLLLGCHLSYVFALFDFWHETQKQRVNKSVQFANPPPLCHHSWLSSIWRLLTTLDVKLPDFYCLLLFTTSSNINRASSFRDPDFSIYI